jgi:hypothetical protein
VSRTAVGIAAGLASSVPDWPPGRPRPAGLVAASRTACSPATRIRTSARPISSPTALTSQHESSWLRYPPTLLGAGQDDKRVQGGYERFASATAERSERSSSLSSWRLSPEPCRTRPSGDSGSGLEVVRRLAQRWVCVYRAMAAGPLLPPGVIAGLMSVNAAGGVEDGGRLPPCEICTGHSCRELRGVEDREGM